MRYHRDGRDNDGAKVFGGVVCIAPPWWDVSVVVVRAGIVISPLQISICITMLVVRRFPERQKISSTIVDPSFGCAQHDQAPTPLHLPPQLLRRPRLTPLRFYLLRRRSLAPRRYLRVPPILSYQSFEKSAFSSFIRTCTILLLSLAVASGRLDPCIVYPGVTRTTT